MSGGFRARAKGPAPRTAQPTHRAPAQDSGRGRDQERPRDERRSPRGDDGDRREFRGRSERRDQGGRPERRDQGGRRDDARGGHRNQRGNFRDGGRGRRDKQRAPETLWTIDPARQVAYNCIRQVVREDGFANLILPGMLKRHRIEGRDAAFATELAYGTLRSLGVIDAVIDAASTRPLEQLDDAMVDCLRLGVYQILFLRVDDHAAVDTTVKLVGSEVGEKGKGFANAVLRTVTRQDPAQWREQLSPTDPIGALAFTHAHPRWIAQSFAATLCAGKGLDFDPETVTMSRSDDDTDEPVLRGISDEVMAELEQILEADSARPIVHLVARPGLVTQEEMCALTGADESRYSPYGGYLQEGNPGEFEVITQRLAAVQDEGSQLIARLVCEAEVLGTDHGRWLDLCAGPGGKTALMAALAAISGAHVDAVEPAEHRAELVQKTIRDLFDEQVTIHVADGRDSGLKPGFDRILVDAPCSGLGALRRRPEARWRKQASDLEELTTLQQQLADAAYRLLRPGGVLVYSTCSPDLKETRHIVDALLSSHRDLEELDTRPYLNGLGEDTAFLSTQMWPHRDGTDAMFVALLRKKDSSTTDTHEQ